MSDQPVYKYLQDAAQLIEDVGWCQGSNEKKDEEGRVYAFCLAGALIAVTWVSLGETRRSCLAAISMQLNDEGNEPFAVSWNDRRERTAEEVTGLLWRAADRLKEARQ